MSSTIPEHLELERIDVADPSIYEDDSCHEYFRRLRQEDPVHLTQSKDFGTFWSVTKFHDIQFVDKNHHIFSSEPTTLLLDQPQASVFTSFSQTDPPKHGMHRKSVQNVASPKNVQQLEPIIRTRAAAILDDLPVGETFNWVERVSIELTTQMLATLFDFPFDDRYLLTHWSDVAISTPELTGADAVTEQERLSEVDQCLAYFTQLWHERANKPPKLDLISMLAHGEETRDMVNNPNEFLGNILLLIIGGNDTTRNSISGGVQALNAYPPEHGKLRENPNIIQNMVSEIIRWQSPLSYMCRRAKTDTELGGKQIKEGDRVAMWYVSGNRDSDAIERADEFWIDRPNARRHLSFGFGIHRCMGNRLAEMQLRVLWEEIQKRFRFVEVVGDPVRVRSNFIRGFSELPVRIHMH